jgi:hypothetical protein
VDGKLASLAGNRRHSCSCFWMVVSLQEGTLNRLVMAGTFPPLLSDAFPALPLPCGDRHLGDAVEMLLSAKAPKSGGVRLACSRGSAACAYGELDSALFIGWAKKLEWVKRPARELLSVEQPALVGDQASAAAASASAAAPSTSTAKGKGNSKGKAKSKSKGKRRK